MISALRSKWQKTTIVRSARILSKKDQRKILGVITLQSSFGVLDLLGVAAIGMLGSLAISGVGSQKPGNRVSSVLQFLHIQNYPLQKQAMILGLAAATLLVGKTLFSIYFTRRILFFLSRRGALLSSTLISKLFSQSLLTVQSRSMNEMMYSVTNGVGIITVGVLGTTVSLVSDASLLLVMGLGLFLVDPLVALSTFLIFGFIGFILYRFMHVKARNLGIQQSEIGIKSGEKILEVIRSYRETIVRNRRHYYSRAIGRQRLELADISAEMSFMPHISKYVMEITVVLGLLIMSAFQFATQDAARAVALLAIFLVASTRIGPAVLRIQQGAISIKSSLGAATPTLELIELLGDALPIENVDDNVHTTHDGFSSTVELHSVSFKYPSKNYPAVKEVSLSIEKGQFVALVGPSGAGKTTIVDVLLGILTADSGQVLISGLPPLLCIAKWPGAISYVPQDVMISNGTIRENVGMGYPPAMATDELVWGALEIAQLDAFVKALPMGLDTPVGDRGTSISGGQRQRLGIARAMFTKPLLLVLDEATSSLDGETEANISGAIHAMRGSVTVLMIAHRLSTVRNADVVAYMAAGEVMSTGTFEEVRIAVPDFDRQAALMGL
jgi:ABC-type multidrug transport system fused ATPase/permease subunit